MFSDVTSIDELKKAYRKLAFQYHPDRGGNLEMMKKVNAEYESLFKKLNVADDKGNSKYKLDDGFREMINKIINLDGLEIEICGSWIWVGGETTKHKEALGKNGAGFFYASRKKMWYWRPEEARVRASCGMGMDYIRNMYGSETVKTSNKDNESKRITA